MTTKEGKGAITKLTKQFLVRHNYFGTIWKNITPKEKYIFPEIIASGKGIIAYKNIASQDSLDVIPENGIFFEKSEFYSELKQKFVSDE